MTMGSDSATTVEARNAVVARANSFEATMLAILMCRLKSSYFSNGLKRGFPPVDDPKRVRTPTTVRTKEESELYLNE